MDYVIIVAGGKGLRMGGEVPKQFLPVGGRPVLMRTIERFEEYGRGAWHAPAATGSGSGVCHTPLRVILVLPKAQQDYWHELCQQYQFNADYLLADGGETRFHSVQNGLALIPDNAQGVVGVHDGVRPFVNIDVIRRCYEAARTTGAVIPVVPVVETLRQVLGDGCWVMDDNAPHPPTPNTHHPTPITQHPSQTVPRDQYRLVQTPQCFDIQLLKAANRQPYTDLFTDDASVVESYGHAITLVDGNRENIKLTTPFDLKIAETLV